MGWDNLPYAYCPARLYFNPPTPCGVGPVPLLGSHLTRLFQSTHPLWRGTINHAALRGNTHYFNPPTPCGVGRGRGIMVCNDWKFQSTHPLWGGTGIIYGMYEDAKISIHPPLVGWDKQQLSDLGYQIISIHPPLVGWDAVLLINKDMLPISIHPPLVGWDMAFTPLLTLHQYFNPPTPCGVGPLNIEAIKALDLFQSTHPLWGGTFPAVLVTSQS